jgi:hypothetical protein
VHCVVLIFEQEESKRNQERQFEQKETKQTKGSRREIGLTLRLSQWLCPGKALGGQLSSRMREYREQPQG